MMETSVSFVKTEVVATMTAAPTSAAPLETLVALIATPIPPTRTPFSLTPFDRHDPEAIVRVYFDAWNRNDWATMNALAQRDITHGSVEYVRVLEIQDVSPSPHEPVYRVVFEIKGQGQEETKLIKWKYYLSWDAQGDAWYISNQCATQ